MSPIPIDIIRRELGNDERVLFAYLYGSVVEEGSGNDIDIAVYTKRGTLPHEFSADMKIRLHRALGLDPDLFDIRVLNTVIENGDILGLLYLQNVLEGSRLIVDKDPDARADFLERYALRYRECEGMKAELLA